MVWKAKHWLAKVLKRRILVVDDQPDITITLKIALEEGGGFCYTNG